LDPITDATNIAYSIHFYAAPHRQSLRNQAAAALKNGIALFCTEYGASSASGGDAYDPAETQLWWNWLDENYVGCANGRRRPSAKPPPHSSRTPTPRGPWTDDMLKPSALLVRDFIISKYQSAQGK
jgi:endoglucanase